VTGREGEDATRRGRGVRGLLPRFLAHYGMLGILLLLGAFFSIITLREQQPEGARAARSLARRVFRETLADARIVLVERVGAEDPAFVRTFASDLARGGRSLAERIPGDPTEVRRLLEHESPPLVIATPASNAPTVRTVLSSFPDLAGVQVLQPESYRWPTFLLASNLRNIANQIAVIAILAVGMTLVIITGGIDLSVGSLIALSAVVAAGVVGKMGGETAGTGALLVASLAAVLLCALVGLFSGFVVTRFRVPPFIATLGMMQVASGIAYILSQGKPIYRIPDVAVALGRGADPVLGVPWAVWLMLTLYAAAHVVMSRTAFGRHVYAVGSNEEAARLAGVRVKRVLLAVYLGSGLLAGLGGVVTASQLKSGAPTYGLMYELYVIAAVVVGGTTLSGGEGKILGTLIGAFIIAVIQNGMNLANVESYTQKVVLGLVILGAVLLDRLKQRGLARRRTGPAGEEP
jgi:ribose transport system permease protein